MFSTQEQLVAHEKAHRVMPALSCTVCRKSFGDSIGLQNHMSVHAGERPFACDICLKAFADSGSLAKHRARGCYPLSAMCLDLTKLPCNDCGKVHLCSCKTSLNKILEYFNYYLVKYFLLAGFQQFSNSF